MVKDNWKSAKTCLLNALYFWACIDDISNVPAPVQPIRIMYTLLNHLVYEVNLFSILVFASLHFDLVYFFIYKMRNESQ